MEECSNNCCICFGVGEYDMWNFKVALPLNDCIDSSLNDDRGIEEEISARDMFRALCQNQFSQLDTSMTIHLLCELCLEQLIVSFVFMRKLEKAQYKLAELTVEDIETPVEFVEENAIDKYLHEQSDECLTSCKQNFNPETLNSPVVFDNLSMPLQDDSFSQSLGETIGYDAQNTDSLIEISPDIACEEVSSFYPASQHRDKRRTKKNAKIFLTDGVSQMLSHINNPENSENDIKIDSITVAQTSPVKKRIRKYYERGKQRTCEQGSFVLTQFIPSVSPVKAAKLDSAQQGLSSEIRTMDYAAVEVQGAGNLQVNESDIIDECCDNGSTATRTLVANDEEDEEPKSQPIYMCKYCPKAFSASQFLITHMRRIHVCKYCTDAFTEAKDLYEHIRAKHSAHKCAICGKELSTQSNLRCHIKRVHGVQLPAHVRLLDFRRHSLGEENDVAAKDMEFLEDFNECDSIQLANDESEKQLQIEYQSDESVLL